MTTERVRLIYKIRCADGSRYVIYNAAAFAPASNHHNGRWYYLPCPAAYVVEISEPFETAEDAERAAYNAFPGRDATTRP